MSGQKGVFTAFNVDGGDYTSSHFCGRVEMTPTFTVEALQELQVLRSTFSAEFGRSTGGVVNLATKRDRARKSLDSVISDYPRSPASAEAEEILKSL